MHFKLFLFIFFHVHSSFPKGHPVDVHFKSISYALYVHSSSRKGHPVDVHFKSISYSHVNIPFSSLKGHPMDVNFKSGQDVDVSWIFGPKMDVHRTFCAIWESILKRRGTYMHDSIQKHTNAKSKLPKRKSNEMPIAREQPKRKTSQYHSIDTTEDMNAIHTTDSSLFMNFLIVLFITRIKN